ncbi:MAG: hypothetical protein ABI388_10865 [Bacteroidia bacterium]
MKELNTNNKNVLIISYVFPPTPGIGGRRWAKFAKYLNKKGVKVSVISTKYEAFGVSTWAKDVEGLDVERIISSYPKILNQKPNNFFEKINYRLQLLRLKLSTKGSYYDKAILLEKRLKKTILKTVTEKKIDTIIVSGFPFNLLYFVCKLKPLLQDIKIICDLRDPWTWKETYSLDIMPQFRKDEERRKERFCIETSDVIFVPTNKMQVDLIVLYPKENTKIIELPHGYDSDEIIDVATKKTHNSNKIKFINYGTIYINLENEMKILSDLFSGNVDKCSLDFYTNHNKYIGNFEVKNLVGKNIFYHSELSEKELYQELLKHNYYLFICPDYGMDNISTKFYEIIYHRIPIVFIGETGVASQFIENNNLGIFIHKNDIVNGLQKIINRETKFNYNNSFDVSAFSFDKLTDKLIEML